MPKYEYEITYKVYGFIDAPPTAGTLEIEGLIEMDAADNFQFNSEVDDIDYWSDEDEDNNDDM